MFAMCPQSRAGAVILAHDRTLILDPDKFPHVHCVFQTLCHHHLKTISSRRMNIRKISYWPQKYSHNELCDFTTIPWLKWSVFLYITKLALFRLFMNYDQWLRFTRVSRLHFSGNRLNSTGFLAQSINFACRVPKKHNFPNFPNYDLTILSEMPQFCQNSNIKLTSGAKTNIFWLKVVDASTM